MDYRLITPFDQPTPDTPPDAEALPPGHDLPVGRQPGSAIRIRHQPPTTALDGYWQRPRGQGEDATKNPSNPCPHLPARRRAAHQTRRSRTRVDRSRTRVVAARDTGKPRRRRIPVPLRHHALLSPDASAKPSNSLTGTPPATSHQHSATRHPNCFRCTERCSSPDRCSRPRRRTRRNPQIPRHRRQSRQPPRHRRQPPLDRVRATNVLIHQVATATELGDIQVAIDLGPQVDTTALPMERQVRHALEVSTGLQRLEPNRRSSHNRARRRTPGPRTGAIPPTQPATRPLLDPPATGTTNPPLVDLARRLNVLE